MVYPHNNRLFWVTSIWRGQESKYIQGVSALSAGQPNAEKANAIMETATISPSLAYSLSLSLSLCDKGSQSPSWYNLMCHHPSSHSCKKGLQVSDKMVVVVTFGSCEGGHLCPEWNNICLPLTLPTAHPGSVHVWHNGHSPERGFAWR